MENNKIKIATTKYPVMPLIRHRWSPIAFSDQQIEEDNIQLLFEAASWAASARNEQPWRFIYASKTDPQNFERLLNCLEEGNKAWAKFAPFLMLTIVKNHYTHNGAENKSALHDLGLAIGNLSLQATAMNLFVHNMAGFDKTLAQQEFSIPEGYQAVTMVAIGYLGNPDLLSDNNKKSELTERNRKSIHEFAGEGLLKL